MQKTASMEILMALTTSIRIISDVQIGTLIQSEDERQTHHTIKGLTSSGMIERVGGLMARTEHKLSPVFCWKTNLQTDIPSFEALSYRLKHRRHQDRKHVSIFRASRKAFKSMGLTPSSRPARRSDWEHDLGVAATWLSLKDDLNRNHSRWILEDDFVDEIDGSLCKPDAVIKQLNRELEFIEYGGCYSADTLRNKFESWEHIDWRLF